MTTTNRKERARLRTWLTDQLGPLLVTVFGVFLGAFLSLRLDAHLEEQRRSDSLSALLEGVLLELDVRRAAAADARPGELFRDVASARTGIESTMSEVKFILDDPRFVESRTIVRVFLLRLVSAYKDFADAHLGAGDVGSVQASFAQFHHALIQLIGLEILRLRGDVNGEQLRTCLVETADGKRRDAWSCQKQLSAMEHQLKSRAEYHDATPLW